MARLSPRLDIMDELRREVEELRLIEREVQEKVTLLKEAGEEIGEGVFKWLKEAHDIDVKLTTCLQVATKAKSTLANRCCSCFKSRMTKEDAFEIKTYVDDLLAQGKSIFPGEEIDLVWRDGFYDFESRRSTYTRVMEGLKDNDIGIIGILGLGGIGKTKLVTEIGKRAKDEKLFDHVLMATISQNPDIRNIQWTLADMLDLTFRDDEETSRTNELRARLENERKVLVIMDDVWDEINLDSVGVSPYSNRKGCKIILTTRREKVCEDMCCNLVVRLDLITHAEAWALFTEHADLKAQKSVRVLTNAKNIVKKCGGLPLAIVIVGSALRDKDLEDYEDALHKLCSSNFVNVESADREIYSILNLSYEYLKDEDTQKCFLLCCLFPEDSTITVKELTRYAHGQWLFQYVNSFHEAKRRIFGSVKKLQDASLLSHVTRRSPRPGDYFQTWPIVKMHDLVRDFASWRARINHDFFYVVNKSNKLQKKRPYENATAFYLRRFDWDWQYPNKSEYPNLKILIISSSISISSMKKFQGNTLEMTNALQVLDVQSSSLVNSFMPPIWFEHLKNLRSLRLEGVPFSRNANLSMIRNLVNLEILELNLGSQQKVLPAWVGELCNLRMLDLSTWYVLEVIPPNLLSRLVKLEELYTPSFHYPQGIWNTDYLSDLKFLLGLTSFAGTFMSIESLPKDFRLRNMEMYYINCRPDRLKDESIKWNKTLGLDDVNDFAMKLFENLLPNVECLKIVGKLYIRGIQNLCPQIDKGGFQNLRELFLGCIYNLECLINTSELGLPPLTPIFPNLLHLTLENIIELCSMCHGKPPVHYLEELRTVTIIRCCKLKNIVPDMLPVGLKLEVLEIEDCLLLKYVYDLVNEQPAFQHTKNHLKFAPSPKVLELHNLPQLQNIWNLPPQSEFIEKHNDAELCKLILKCLGSLVQMNIRKCLELEEIFPVIELDNQNADAPLSSLVDLSLSYLPRLKCIWKGSQQNCSLQNLERIEVVECGALTSIFTSTLIRSLRKLQYLVIKDCDVLETIIVNDDQNEANRGKAFQEIKEIKIELCDNLNTVLPISYVVHGLQKLEIINIKKCANLQQVFGEHCEEHEAEGSQLLEHNNQKSNVQLSSLVELDLIFLPNLKCIWNGPEQNCSLKNLERIRLEKCDTLTSLFTLNLARSLQKLQYLAIVQCEALEIFINEDDQDEAISKSKKSFQEIKEIEIISCPRLKTLLPVSFVQNLSNLKRILIDDCAELEQVFGDSDVEVLTKMNNEESDSQLMNLVELDFALLPKLKRIWNSRQQNCLLRNLELIKLKECDTLTSVFTPTQARSLHKLQYLLIDTCQALETIITKDDQPEKARKRPHSSQYSFQEIKKVQIISCDKLKSIIPISFVAQNLSKLERISIINCGELRQVFGDDEEGKVGDYEEIFMDDLKELKLIKLPRLARFSPLKYSVLISFSSHTKEGGKGGPIDLLELLPRSQTRPHTWIWMKHD
ncbi:unnamed protein product [Amaranthus hypochondriacus]